jgi:hypothetical protein
MGSEIQLFHPKPEFRTGVNGQFARIAFLLNWRHPGVSGHLKAKLMAHAGTMPCRSKATFGVMKDLSQLLGDPFDGIMSPRLRKCVIGFTHIATKLNSIT